VVSVSSSAHRIVESVHLLGSAGDFGEPGDQAFWIDRHPAFPQPAVDSAHHLKATRRAASTRISVGPVLAETASANSTPLVRAFGIPDEPFSGVGDQRANGPVRLLRRSRVPRIGEVVKVGVAGEQAA